MLIMKQIMGSSEANISLSSAISRKAENYGGIKMGLRNWWSVFTYTLKKLTTSPRIKPVTWIHTDKSGPDTYQTIHRTPLALLNISSELEDAILSLYLLVVI